MFDFFHQNLNEKQTIFRRVFNYKSVFFSFASESW